MSDSASCFWNSEPTVLDSVLTVRGREAPLWRRFPTTTSSFSGRLFELAAFNAPISKMSYDRAARIFCAFRCVMSGSNPVSRLMMWKYAVGSPAAKRPM